MFIQKQLKLLYIFLSRDSPTSFQEFLFTSTLSQSSRLTDSISSSD